METCRGRKNDGTPCGSAIVLNNDYCRAHQYQVHAPYRWTEERLTNAIKANAGRAAGLDLTPGDLSGLDLIGLDLHCVNLDNANLRDAQLLGASLEHASMCGADLRGANLWCAKLQHANLRHTHWQGAELKEADLQGADLEYADLQQASLRGANLRGSNLRFTDLRGLELRDILSGGLQGACFYGARLEGTKLAADQLAPAIGDEDAAESRGIWTYLHARGAYLALKRSFEGLGDYEAASWAYIKERQMGKMCSAPWRARRLYGKEQLRDTRERKLPWYQPRVWWFFIRHTGKWAGDWLVELLCKYGESVRRVLSWMVLVLLGFATYYWHIVGVWLVQPDGGDAPATSFWHYLLYSAGAFTTTSFDTLRAADDRVRLITAFQAIVGVFLAGLLGFVAGNRIRRS